MLFWVILGIVGTLTLISCGFPPVRCIFAGIVITVLGPFVTMLHPLAPLALWIGLGFVGGWIMARKGYQPLVGVLIGLVGGPFGLLAALSAPYTSAGHEIAERERQIEAEREAARQTRACPKYE